MIVRPRQAQPYMVRLSLPTFHQILLLALVLLGDLLGQLLPVVERIVDTLLAGDDSGDVLADLGAEVSELRDVDKLDANSWPRLDTRIDWVGLLNRLECRLAESSGLLLVLGVLIGRDTLAGWHRCPAVLRTNQFLVLLRRCPGDELPGIVLLGALLLDRPRPGVQPAGRLRQLDGCLGIRHLALH